MYCANCGKPVDKGAAYCGYCGFPILRPEELSAPSYLTNPHRALPKTSDLVVVRKHRRALLLTILIVVIALIIIGLNSPEGDLLFLIAVAPSGFLLWYFYHADKYKYEPLRLIAGTFIIGALLFFVALLIESSYGQPTGIDGGLAIFLYFLFGIGLVEESIKFISVRIYAYRSPLFDEPMDGIVYGVAAGLGFATVENIFYVFENGIANAFARSLISVPGHAFWGAILGYYLARSKLERKPLLAVAGLSIAVFFHGLFDTLTTVISNGVLAFVLLFSLVWMTYFFIVRREIKEAEKESPHSSGGPPAFPPSHPP